MEIETVTPELDDIDSQNLKTFQSRLLRDLDMQDGLSVSRVALAPCSTLRDVILSMDLADIDYFRPPFVLQPLPAHPITYAEATARMRAEVIISTMAQIHAELQSTMQRWLVYVHDPSASAPALSMPQLRVLPAEPMVSRFPQIHDRDGPEYECLTFLATFLERGHSSVWADVAPHEVVLLTTHVGNRRLFMIGLTIGGGNEADAYRNMEIQLSGRIYSSRDRSKDLILEKDFGGSGRAETQRLYMMELAHGLLNKTSGSREPQAVMDHGAYWQMHSLGSIWGPEIIMSIATSSKPHIKKVLFCPAACMDKTADDIRQGRLYTTAQMESCRKILNVGLPFPLLDAQLLAVIGIVSSLAYPEQHNWIGVRGPPGTAKTTLIAILLSLVKRKGAIKTLISKLGLPEILGDVVLGRSFSVMTQTNAAADQAVLKTMEIIEYMNRFQIHDSPFSGKLIRVAEFSHYRDADPALFRSSLEYHGAQNALHKLRREIGELPALLEVWDKRQANKDSLRRARDEAGIVCAMTEDWDAIESQIEAVDCGEIRPWWVSKGWGEKARVQADWLESVTNSSEPYKAFKSTCPAYVDGSTTIFTNREVRTLIREEVNRLYDDPDHVFFHTAGMLNPSRPHLVDKTGKDVVIVDEASMVTRATAAACGARSNRLILIGDERQLPPHSRASPFHIQEQAESILKMASASPNFYDLNVSFRLHPLMKDILNSSYYDGLIDLNVSFRLHPLMKDILNSSYYDGLIETTRFQHLRNFSPLHVLPLFRPLIAIDVRRPAVKNSSSSSANYFEAKAVAIYLSSMNEALKSTITPKLRVAVLSLYLYQTEILKGFVGNLSLPYLDVSVLTVDKAQGKEVDVVILSLVTSSALNSKNKSIKFTDTPRINVALSRARSSVAIIGDLQHWRQSDNAILRSFLASPDLCVHDMKDKNVEAIKHAMVDLALPGYPFDDYAEMMAEMDALDAIRRKFKL